MTTQELIEKTKELIRIPSTGDNLPALRQAFEVIADMVTDCPGINIEYFERNGKPSLLAYRGRKRPDTFDIILNGHLDVVPGKPDLFQPRVKNGRLYGRGALDMKGTTVVLTDVFRELVNKVPYNLGLQIVTDEELGGYDGCAVQIEQGVRAKFVIMGEYANEPHAIYNAARGLCWAEITFNGRSAHGGHLWHGANAVVKASEFAAAVLERYPTPDRETWTTTASIASLSTPNTAYNKVPDQAVLKIDFRFTQEDPVFASRESMEAFVASIDPDAQITDLATFEPAVHVDDLNPYVQGLSAAVVKATGAQPKFLGRPAASDGRHFALVGNDLVEFGLFGNHSHSDEEYVEIASFDEYQATLHAFLNDPLPKKLKQAMIEEKAPLHEQLFRDLVPIPSTSDNREANNTILHLVEGFVKQRGMHVTNFEQNGFRSIIATTKPKIKRPLVLLNAHTDVVPASLDMFDLRLEDGKFFGRGVMDMKHAIAAYLTVVDRLKDNIQDYDFGLMITSDEEIGSENGVKPLVQEHGYGAGVVIIPDGGNNWELEHFAKGVLWMKLEASGKEAHASRPWEGESAIHRLLGAIKEIQQLVVADPAPEDTLLSVGTIQGGKAANQIAAQASAMIDIRTGSIEDHERLPGQIQDICRRHGVAVELVAEGAPCATDPKAPLIKEFVDIVTEVTGSTHPTRYDFAVTDGRFFSPAGFPTIVINPECGDIHCPGEWISQKGLAQFCDVIERYVRQVARIKVATKATKSTKTKKLSVA